MYLVRVPSSLSHGMAAVAIGSVMVPRALVRPFLLTGAVCAVLPDLDGIGRWWYGAAGDVELLGGHRGFTHSLTYAALCGVLAAIAMLPSARWNGLRLRFGVFIALATASHGVLDALTSIGAKASPVQFFSPFSTEGYTSAWQPIHGPFSELFLLLLPLIALTRIICRGRGIPWPRWRAPGPLTLGLTMTSRSGQSGPKSDGDS